MTGFGFFQTSVSGLDSQGQALATISNNIANISTVGYKQADVAFETVLSQEYAGDAALSNDQGPLSIQADIGGVRMTALNRISGQGTIQQTGQPFDLAISGNGLFVFRQGVATSSDMVFGRNGQLTEAVGDPITVTGASGQSATITPSYFVDQNGHYLQGWAANADGTFPTDAASLGPIRSDVSGIANAGRETTTATLDLNLPAGDAVGTAESCGLQFCSSAGVQQQATATFVKATTDSWDLQVAGQAGDVVSLTPSQPLTFNTDGSVAGPSSYRVAITHADGSSSAFSLDVSSSTHYASGFQVRDNSDDGYPKGSLERIEFDRDGYLNGYFANGQTQRLYRLPLATFPNIDGLTPLQGNVYAMSDTSGALAVQGVGEGGTGLLLPETLEASTVDLEDQFSRMIQTQQAYNSSATAFKTMDEMLVTVRDL